MEKAPDRGSAAVILNGRQVAVVDTNAATSHSTVVWQTVLPAGTHTLKIVDLATPGHPRIDVDAVLN